MRHPFQTYKFHMRYACEACRFGVVPFWTLSECPRECAYDKMPGSNPIEILIAYFCCTISGVQSENSGVMLLKFHPDLN
jgi:hypothetical protein